MANIQNSPNYDKLKKVLKEVFQLDQADLDFGIYRIMNQKRNEINDFLENRLLPQVTEILQSNGDGSNNKVKQELEKAIEQANSLGVDPDTLPKVIELRKKLTSTTSVDSLEQEVYSHLANFFKRYYKDGDFISLRRYKKDVYAIPYEGEEVKLHWANHDQYYIKTSEYLKNYGFNLSNGKAVKFELKEASTEQNNNKEQSGKERRFQLFEELPLEVSEDGKTIIINFTYEEHDKKVKQDKLNDEAVETIVKSIPQEFHALLEKRPTDKNKNRTLLEKHVLDFTARNSFDYFIHKDLGGFLSRELDFYIKNEVLYLDDINTENEQDFTSQLSKVKAIKQVAQKIITFLAQIENFQKKLWLKKKFVVSTNYCITLDRIPEKYYEEIAKNKAQIDEWKELFKIDKIKGDLLSLEYSEPLSLDFLKSQPYLILDTKFFDENFKSNLLAEFDDLENQLNGLLINSENFQALNTISGTYKNRLDGIYIDPPYNTNAMEIVYKNGYKDSSWCSLMNDRISLGKVLLKDNGIKCVTIDECEVDNLSLIMKQNLKGYGIRPIIIEYNHRGRVKSNFAITHEYGLWAIPENRDLITRKKEVSEDIRRNLRRTGTDSLRTDVPSQFYGIEVNKKTLEIVKVHEALEVNSPIPDFNSEVNTIIYPIDDDGIEKRWYYGRDRVIDESKTGSVYAKIIKGKYHIHYHQVGKEKMRKSVWVGSDLDASTHGTELLNSIFGMGNRGFSFPKSLYAVRDSIECMSPTNSGIFLDFFSGSGTTGHAIISLNKTDNGNRKFILVEMGSYFNTVTKPRIQKIIYSEKWENGVPIENKGYSSIIKYQDLESYEDALNNLSLVKNKEQSSLLASSDFKDEYMLSYMLDMESRDSLLNVDAFKNPFNYKLNITRNNESQETIIDLVETFNYLIGLHVKTMQTIRGFKVITGVTNERNEETLVIWRNTEEKSNQDLNEFFTKMEFSTRDTEFQRIYVNGDNHIENLKTGEDSWKVVLIEEEFMKRMFDVQDV